MDGFEHGHGQVVRDDLLRVSAATNSSNCTPGSTRDAALPDPIDETSISFVVFIRPCLFALRLVLHTKISMLCRKMPPFLKELHDLSTFYDTTGIMFIKMPQWFFGQRQWTSRSITPVKTVDHVWDLATFLEAGSDWRMTSPASFKSTEMEKQVECVAKQAEQLLSLVEEADNEWLIQGGCESYVRRIYCDVLFSLNRWFAKGNIDWSWVNGGQQCQVAVKSLKRSYVMEYRKIHLYEMDFVKRAPKFQKDGWMLIHLSEVTSIQHEKEKKPEVIKREKPEAISPQQEEDGIPEATKRRRVHGQPPCPAPMIQMSSYQSDQQHNNPGFEWRAYGQPSFPAPTIQPGSFYNSQYCNNPGFEWRARGQPPSPASTIPYHNAQYDDLPQAFLGFDTGTLVPAGQIPYRT